MNQLNEQDMIIDEKDFPKCPSHEENLVVYGCLNTMCEYRLLCQKCIQYHSHKPNIQYYEFLCELIKKNKPQAQQNFKNWNLNVGNRFKPYLDQQFLAQFTKQIDDQVKQFSIFFEKINKFIGNCMQELIGQLEEYKQQLQIKYKEFIKEYQQNIQQAKVIQFFTPNVLNTKLIQQGSQANSFLKQIEEIGPQNNDKLYQFDAFIKTAPEVSKQIKIFEEKFIKFINNKDTIAEEQIGFAGIQQLKQHEELVNFNKYEESDNDKIQQQNKDAENNQIQVIQNVYSSTQEIKVQGLTDKNYELEFKQLNRFKDWVVTSILLLPQNLLVFLQKGSESITLFDFTNQKIIQQVNLKINNNTWLVQLTNELFISGGGNQIISLLKYQDKQIYFKRELQLGNLIIVQALNLGSKTFVVINAEGTIIYYNLNNNIQITSQEWKVPSNKKSKIRLTLIQEQFQFGAYITGESNSYIFQIDEAGQQIKKVSRMYKAPTIIWRNPKKCCLLSQSGIMIAKDESSELEEREVDTIMITQNKITYVVTLPISQGICKRFIVNDKDEVQALDQPDICEKQSLSQFYYPRIQVFKGNSGKINVFIANPENLQCSLTLFEINIK